MLRSSSPLSPAGLLVIYFLTMAPGPLAGQEIKFANSVHDVGRLKAGKIVEYDFGFTNTGDSLLVVSNVQTSCGCTTAGSWTKKIEPGKAGLIPIRLNSSRIGGPINVSIRVTSNDRLQPSVVLKLQGNVFENIEARPRFALFVLPGDLSSNAVRVLDITNNTGEPVSLGPPIINDTNFTAEIKTNEPGRDYQLIVHLESPPLPGRPQGLITIRTSCKTQPILAISVITVTPSEAGSPGVAGAVAPGGPTPASAGIQGALSPSTAPLLETDGIQKLDDLQAEALFHDPRYQQHRIVFIDARNDQDYQAGHIPGAYQFDPYHPDKYLAAVLLVCQAAEQVVVYCQGSECEDSQSADIVLRENGIMNRKLFVYAGGMTGWTALHLPVEMAAQSSGQLLKTESSP